MFFHWWKVLIETLWNVKEEDRTYERAFIGVLIETLWNVKILSVKMDTAYESINRNIVECKVLTLQ